MILYLKNRLITIDLIKNIHSILMKGLLDNDLCGVFRKTYVCASNSCMEYVNSKMIEKKLNILVDFLIILHILIRMNIL